MRKKKIRLLSKALLFYLFFTLISFIISAIILQKEANKHMHRILENRFSHRQRHIAHILKHKPEKFKNSPYSTVSMVDHIPDVFQPVYSDTMMVNEHTQRQNVYRKKVTYLTVDGKHYKLEMTKEADELYRFKDDVFHIVLPVFIVLVIAIFLANYLLSGYVLDPFRRILKQMASYRIGNSRLPNQIKTSTREFDRLKKLFEKMRQRIENDYFQLKEYTENMSHELQTPLSIIQNKTESLLSSGDIKPSHAKELKVIYEETQQLSRLGRALNLITQIENQEFKDVRIIHTKPVIESHLDKIHEMADIKGFTIETHLDPDHVLTTDPGLLDIMVRNLIKNAIRYAYPSSVIRIDTSGNKFSIVNSGDKTDFSGQDIFKRFKRAGNLKSLGLGLAIVKKICEVSELDINYQYHEGQHIFTILPLDE